MILALVTVILILLAPVELQQQDVHHCWKVEADSLTNSELECPGVTARLLKLPDNSTFADIPIKITAAFNLTMEFYTWAIEKKYFPNRIQTAEAAREFCENGPCSEAPAPETCCIWRFTVNTCPVSKNFTNRAFCGPWLPTDGVIVGHNRPQFGLASRSLWNATIPELILPGNTVILVTFFIGLLKISTNTALFSVLRAVCGDGACDPSQNETCVTCPKDCGACSLEARVGGAIIAVVFLIIMGTGAIGLFFFRRSRLALWDNSWIILRENVIIIANNNQKTSHAILEESGDNSDEEEEGKPFIYGKIGDTLVSVKYVEREQFLLTKNIRKEIKAMRQLSHRNLCQLVGICLEPPELAIFMEYCPKRSLRDVCHNEVMPSSWAFKLSLIQDIICGVEFLHAHGFIHGRLNSQNCVVDDRLTCKITDFGLESIRYNKPEEKLETFLEDPRNWAFIAPEYRGNAPAPPNIHMDSFSYGTIMCEVAQSREDPEDFNAPDLTEGERQELMVQWWDYPLPNVDAFEGCADDSTPNMTEYINLIRLCWSPVDVRPAFDVIRAKMDLINPRRKNPIDIILSLMEKYSAHLESIVSERTQDLIAEKQRTDELLHSMLPKTIANQLRSGQAVPAEAYSSCTIYFSDIVGFTNISSDSTPFQVVALLNKLYSEFDQIIDRYDVYKVETIGDAYMVASGVPRRNGQRHAVSITDMALDLVEVSHSFIIPHMPNEPLKIRVGLHSGPVCAGVVGLKMPRYCLFGDTVNTASRMESNGEAYKIHCSDATHDILSTLGGFHFEERGTIEVKGKGTMRTWWVTGRTRPPIPPDCCPIPIRRTKKTKVPTPRRSSRTPPKACTSAVQSPTKGNPAIEIIESELMVDQKIRSTKPGAPLIDSLDKKVKASLAPPPVPHL
ncbi:atrial natriuretic peptide receptor 1 [Echinococcus multilocularis]|uniref:Guanylate cyclase n=1 Tax=Echinococcus multilocularis TaxID=6211 RepID=A0A068Y9X0_ECHMU|nr:atrial natriuretic peptide receptor 1 [Echinococcus multilocularis]